MSKHITPAKAKTNILTAIATTRARGMGAPRWLEEMEDMLGRAGIFAFLGEPPEDLTRQERLAFSRTLQCVRQTALELEKNEA